MQEVLIVVLAALTSMLTYQFTKSRQTKGDLSFRAALGLWFQFIGTFAFFFGLNVALGLTIILLIRAFTSHFVSVYVLGNLMLVILSAGQGFVFQLLWRRES